MRFILRVKKFLAYCAHDDRCARRFPISTTLNPEALKALIFLQHEQLLSQSEELFRKSEQLASRDSEIEHLKLLIAKLRRMQFGRKSEKLDREIEQLELRLDELEATQAEKAAPSQTPACRARCEWQRNPRGGRCRSICRVKYGSIRRSRKLARTAAES